jgi:RNA recognition motif-containing protein
VNNILVGNLSPSAAEQDIRSIFEQHGTVERLKMMTGLKNRSAQRLCICPDEKRR